MEMGIPIVCMRCGLSEMISEDYARDIYNLINLINDPKGRFRWKCEIACKRETPHILEDLAEQLFRELLGGKAG